MVDGATYWQRVRRITLPLTYKTILLVTLFSVIGSLLAFDQFFLMTAGQPFNRTASSVFWIYLNSFPYLKLGYGAALSLILAVIILAFTVVQMIADAAQPCVSAAKSDALSADSQRAAPERREPAQLAAAALGAAAADISSARSAWRICAIMLAPLVALDLGLAQDHGGGGGDPADLLHAPAQPRQLPASSGATRTACRPISSTAPARRC